MNVLGEDYPPELVFNLDNTGWRLLEAPGGILEEKEKDMVKSRLHTSEKASFTVFGGTACSGDKLPL
jgi:hypothetical protein